jgi:hypothetical protein
MGVDVGNDFRPMYVIVEGKTVLTPFPLLADANLWQTMPGAIAAWTFMLGHTQTTRWRLRHSLAGEIAGEELDHLDRGLGFLVQNARIVVLETNGDGLFLEVPAAFAGYTERLIPSILPGARLARHELGRMARQRVARVEGQARGRGNETSAGADPGRTVAHPESTAGRFPPPAFHPGGAAPSDRQEHGDLPGCTGPSPAWGSVVGIAKRKEDESTPDTGPHRATDHRGDG